jgi:hypothetical protein
MAGFYKDQRQKCDKRYTKIKTLQGIASCRQLSIVVDFFLGSCGEGKYPLLTTINRIFGGETWVPPATTYKPPPGVTSKAPPGVTSKVTTGATNPSSTMRPGLPWMLVYVKVL